MKRGKKKYYRVIISAAHKDHKLVNHSEENLISLCQSCHYIFDNITVSGKAPKVIFEINCKTSFGTLSKKYSAEHNKNK